MLIKSNITIKKLMSCTIIINIGINIGIKEYQEYLSGANYNINNGFQANQTAQIQHTSLQLPIR